MFRLRQPRAGRFLVALAAASIAAGAQSPAFAAVSIKPAAPGARLDATPAIAFNRLSDNAINLAHLMYAAFDAQPFQIRGLPDWADRDLYSVQAVADGTPDRGRMLAMLQTALIDRFSLQLSVVPQRMRVYALVVAPGGVRFHKLSDAPSSAGASQRIPGHVRVNLGTSMTALVRALNERQAMDRPVIDATGITDDGYRLILDVVPSQADSAGGASRSGRGFSMPHGNDLVYALNSQLGLTLEAKTADVNLYTVAAASRPSSN